MFFSYNYLPFLILAAAVLLRFSESATIKERNEVSLFLQSEAGTFNGSPHPHHRHHLLKKRHVVWPEKPEITSFRVVSDIKYRYCRTLVTYKVENHDVALPSQEVTFRVVLPDTAFISKFVMEVGGTKYEAEVVPKRTASSRYLQAKLDHKTTGIVETSTRNANVFKVNVNIKSQETIIFELTYEELLQRKSGRYEHFININPLEAASIQNYSMQVNIKDGRELVNLRVPSLYLSIPDSSEEETEVENNHDAIITRISATEASISWSPTVEDQTDLRQAGFSGRFVVEYDVNRDKNAGELFISQGYFVHFFAPDDLQRIEQNIIFILDISGSMDGEKMEQMKKSQISIMNDLRPTDYFNIVVFSHIVHVWGDCCNLEGIPATHENVRNATEYVNTLRALGGTDIHTALKTGLELINKPECHNIRRMKKAKISFLRRISGDPDNRMSPRTGLDLVNSPKCDNIKDAKNTRSVIILLTDGEPTFGITKHDEIYAKLREYNGIHKIPILSLGFGTGVDFPFLKKLSLQNNGFARKIYEASDAALQIKNFYLEISNLLLTNINFRYISDEVSLTNLTRTRFSKFYKGSDIVVAGKLTRLNFDACDTNSRILHMDNLIDSIITSLGANGTTKRWVDVPANVVDPGACHKIPVSNITTTASRSPDDIFMESLWAYLTIKQLIEEDLAGNFKGSDETPKEKALKLALRYSLVTPLTSLLVVKPPPPFPQFVYPYFPRLRPASVDFSIMPESTSALDASMSTPDVTFSQSNRAPPLAILPPPVHSLPPQQVNREIVVNLKDAFGEGETMHVPFSVLKRNRNRANSNSTILPNATSSVFSPTPNSEADDVPLTLGNITWLRENVTEIRFKGIDYKLGKAKSGQECTINKTGESGHCLHLKDCVLPEFTGKVKMLKPYMCPIVTLSEAETYLGVCCPDNKVVGGIDAPTIANISWLHGHLHALRFNGKIYKIAREIEAETDVSSECQGIDGEEGKKLRCVHLEDCVRKEFATDMNSYKNYFCPISQMVGRQRESFAGICCPTEN